MAYFKVEGWPALGFFIIAGAIFYGMWDKHATAVANGFVPPENRFKFFVSIGDYLIYFILFGLLFYAIKGMPMNRSKIIMNRLAIWALLLFMLWQFGRPYLLAPSIM